MLCINWSYVYDFRILIDSNADLTSVNNEGEVPLDLAEEEEMEVFLSEEIDNQGILIYDYKLLCSSTTRFCKHCFLEILLKHLGFLIGKLFWQII